MDMLRMRQEILFYDELVLYQVCFLVVFLFFSVGFNDTKTLGRSSRLRGSNFGNENSGYADVLVCFEQVIFCLCCQSVRKNVFVSKAVYKSRWFCR